MKLAICLPMYGSVPASFFVNFVNRIHDLYSNGRDWEVKIYMQTATVVDRSRNELVKQALRDGCDYIFFWDTDTSIPKNTIEKLYDMQVDVASGLYFAKGKPYLPVARIKDGDKHFFLEDFNWGETLEVAGVGMGCCLIKADVFTKFKEPWFKLEWRESNGNPYQIAEDLYFCDKATETGHKVFLNTSIVCGHYGIEVDGHHFNFFKEEIKRDKEEREELMEDLAEFEGLSREELVTRFANANKLRREEMEKVDWSNPEEVDKYYQENNYEIYNHFDWHFSSRRPFDKKLLEKIKKEYPDRGTEILDFGCGGGQIDYMLAKEKYIVSVVEKNKKAREFMSHRFHKHKQKIKFINFPIHPRFKNQYDVIFCFDVLEHIPDEEFDETIETLKKLRKKGGKIFATVSFGAQNAHPSHYDMTEYKKKKILELVDDVV